MALSIYSAKALSIYCAKAFSVYLDRVPAALRDWSHMELEEDWSVLPRWYAIKYSGYVRSLRTRASVSAREDL
jgi:hypothetical protein